MSALLSLRNNRNVTRHGGRTVIFICRVDRVAVPEHLFHYTSSQLGLKQVNPTSRQLFGDPYYVYGGPALPLESLARLDSLLRLRGRTCSCLCGKN